MTPPRLALPVIAFTFLSALASAQERPFPQSAAVQYRPGTLKPTPASESLDASTASFHAKWRSRFFVQIPPADIPAGQPAPQAFINANAFQDVPAGKKFRSVSEGHGYGMLISAYLGAHDDFVALNNYFRAHPSHPDPDTDVVHHHLMAFEQIEATLAEVAATTPRNQTDSASDGDMDIAYALLLASRQWPADLTDGDTYATQAQNVLADIMAHDVLVDAGGNALTIKFGDAIVEGSSLLFATRTSDFMVQHWRTFANFDTANRARWLALRANTYTIEANVFANFAPLTGLMPDFVNRAPAKYFAESVPGQPADSTAISIYRPPAGKLLEDKIGDGNWSYNACRTPWRLATDYLVNFGSNDADGTATRAFSQLEVLNSWIQRATTPRLVTASHAPTRLLQPGALPDPRRINAGYYLDGKPIRPAIHDHGSCFNGPLAVSAMIGGGNQPWLDALWQNLLNADALDPSGQEEYYRATVKMLCMIVLSGNWWDPVPEAQ